MEKIPQGSEDPSPYLSRGTTEQSVGGRVKDFGDHPTAAHKGQPTTLLTPGLHVAEVTGVSAGTHDENSCGQ